MAKKILIGLALVTVLFLGFVTTRPGTFRYERTGLINATPERIFPYLSSLKLGGQWSPYERIDPNMKKEYSGPEAGVGAKMHFAGNKDVGEGNLEILKVVENAVVEIRLEMLKPFHGINNIQYTVTPEGAGTRFSWTMSGEANFLSKLVGVFIDCDKMVGEQFEKGIANLKNVAEAPPA